MAVVKVEKTLKLSFPVSMMKSSRGVVEEPASWPLGPWSSRRPGRGAGGAVARPAPIFIVSNCNDLRIQYIIRYDD